jgi:hypothetical protein
MTHHRMFHQKHRAAVVVAPAVADLAKVADDLEAQAKRIRTDIAALGGGQPAPPPPPSHKPPAWPSYTGTSQLVGTSNSDVTVWVDPSLGAPGLQNAKDLLADADRIVAANEGIFGHPSEPVNVIVFALGGATDGTGGADHMGCDFVTGQNIEVCAAFGQSMRCSALFEAELSECAMDGNLCGYSTGEALSRWCANVVGKNALADFSTAPDWAQGGMPNFVDATEPSDGDPLSIGCGMAFISWLVAHGQPLAAVAQKMVALGDAGTLAQVAAELASPPADPATIWPVFVAAVRALPGGVTNDDPFYSATS